MNEQDRMNAAKHMNQTEKNMVMIGADQINNTINENAMTPGNNQTTTSQCNHYLQNKEWYFHWSW
ncbi:MAG: hypothetical protein WA421_12395 [Nitrososphaeraceae archaeon]